MKRLHGLLTEHSFETIFGSFLVLFFSWYTLALCGLFYPPLIWISGLFIIGIIIWKLFSSFRTIHWIYYLSFFLALSIGTLALSSHPLELLAGRDQGSLAEAAVRLVQNHNLTFTDAGAEVFTGIYGPGRALHFPGFYYTPAGDLIPAFPLGYITWLAGFFAIFGIVGISLANLVTFTLSTILITTLLRSYTSQFYTLLGTVLFIVSFLPLWFISFSLSENLALTLFLLTTASLMRYTNAKTTPSLALALGSALALAFTRIEGFGVLTICLLFVLWNKKGQKLFTLNNKPLILTAIFGLFLVVWTFIANLPYFKTIAKALLKIVEKDIAGGGAGAESLLFLELLFRYGILSYVVLALFFALFFLRTKKYTLLIPLLLALPALPYLLVPSITVDVPWMLRRFLFALYPAFFLISWWGLYGINKKYTAWKQITFAASVFILLFVCSLPGLFFWHTTHYSNTLLAEVNSLADHFTPEDLLLIDRDVTGDGYMMPTFPLNTFFNRHAVYFFNPNDLATLDRSSFAKTYLIIPTEKQDFYQETLGNVLSPKTTFTFYNNHSFRNTNQKDPFMKNPSQTIPLIILEIK